LPRGHGGEVAAGAVTSDSDAARICTQIRGMTVRVFESRDRVVDRGREFVLGRAPVLD